MAIGSDSPGTRLAAVVPSDSTAVNCRSLWIGGAGNLSVIAMHDTVAVTITGVPAGTLLPIACNKVMAATTATAIVAIF
jgi:hypothetical protein